MGPPAEIVAVLLEKTKVYEKKCVKSEIIKYPWRWRSRVSKASSLLNLSFSARFIRCSSIFFKEILRKFAEITSFSSFAIVKSSSASSFSRKLVGVCIFKQNWSLTNWYILIFIKNFLSFFKKLRVFLVYWCHFQENVAVVSDDFPNNFLDLRFFLVQHWNYRDFCQTTVEIL